MKRLAMGTVLTVVLVFVVASCSSTGAPDPVGTAGLGTPTVPETGNERYAANQGSPDDAPLAAPRETAGGTSINWAKYANTKVTRVDWSGKVAMLDAGTIDGLREGDSFTTFRGEKVTGMLVPLQVFPRETICAVGKPTPGKTTGKLRVGDRLTPNSYAGKKIGNVGAVGVNSNPYKVGAPSEAELRSLQERLRSAEEGTIPDKGITGAPKTIAEQRKEVEDAWKRTVAKVKSYDATAKAYEAALKH
jgi:hypothetical protein